MMWVLFLVGIQEPSGYGADRSENSKIRLTLSGYDSGYVPKIPASLVFLSQWELRELCLWKSMKIISSTILRMMVHTIGMQETSSIRKQSLRTIWIFPLIMMVSSRENYSPVIETMNLWENLNMFLDIILSHTIDTTPDPFSIGSSTIRLLLQILKYFLSSRRPNKFLVFKVGWGIYCFWMSLFKKCFADRRIYYWRVRKSNLQQRWSRLFLVRECRPTWSEYRDINRS